MSPWDEDDFEDSALAGVAIIFIFVVVVIAVGWMFATSNRPLAKYQEETRRQTFETSRTYIDGKNKTINDYCMNMQPATDEIQRKAIARWIKSESENFSGNLNPSAQSCVSQANNVLEK